MLVDARSRLYLPIVRGRTTASEIANESSRAELDCRYVCHGVFDKSTCTLTALTLPLFSLECIAEYTGRPLLAITCGDLGTNEVAMERELGKWLKLAHKWDAVMLLDEADVFLERRME